MLPAALLAYAKLDLDEEILASALPDDPAFVPLLEGYFPLQARQAFPQEPQRHRLKREIVSTVLINALVNLTGPVFVQRMRELSGQGAAEVARGFVLADGAFGLSALKTRIDALDGKADAKVQNRLYADIADQFRRVTPWFLAHVPADAPIADTVALHRAGVEALRQSYTPNEADTAHIAELAKAGVPYSVEAAPAGSVAKITVGSTVVDSYEGAGLAKDDAKAKGDAFGSELKAALTGAGYPEKADPARINKPMVVLILFVLVLYVTMVYGPIAAMLVEMFPTRIRYTSMSLPYHIGKGWFGGLLPTTAFALVAFKGDIYYGLWYPICVALATLVIGALFVRETKDNNIYAHD